MKVLVLGSEGQIGKPLSDFLKTKYGVIEWDIMVNKSQDLRKYNNVLENHVKNCDFIMFLAFNVGGSKYLNTYESKYEFIEDNLLLMINTFNLIKKYNKKFIFTSSQMSGMLHSTYGNLKLIGEKMTKTLGGINVRYWNVFGYEEMNIKSHVITDFINSAIKNKEIKMLTNGNEERQFIYVNDVCEAMETIMLKYDELEKNEYYDITSYEWSNINQVAEIIKQIIPCEIYKNNNEDNVQKMIKTEPSLHILKYWKPKTSLYEGIKELIVKYI